VPDSNTDYPLKLFLCYIILLYFLLVVVDMVKNSITSTLLPATKVNVGAYVVVLTFSISHTCTLIYLQMVCASIALHVLYMSYILLL
jgi:hypothetical protein